MNESILLNNMNEEQLKRIIAEALHSKIEEIKSAFSAEPQPNMDDDLVSQEQAKEILKRDINWFWRERRSGKLQAVKIGRFVFFKRNDIRKYISANTEQVNVA